MDLEIRDKVVLITGSGQGLGREMGLAFAREGASVAFHYRTSETGAKQAAEEARAAGAAAIAVPADLQDDAAVAAAVERIRQELGPIDVLVNNAAMTGRKPFLETTIADWSAQIDVTITGTLRVTREVLQGMVDEGRGGAIVNLMGDSGRVGESGFLVTATTRAATLGFTKSLAKEFARYGVRANCVSIGVTRTDSIDAHLGNLDEKQLERVIRQYPLRRLGDPSDVVPTVLLLASPLSAWTTGQVVSVNGGYAMP